MSGDSIETINLTQVILETANTLCSSLLESIDKNIYPLLDKVIFVDETITQDSYFKKIFGTSPTSGILMLSNCLIFAFILYYCIRLIISHFSGSEIESPHQFIMRAIIVTIVMNSSLEICTLLINGTQQISSFFTLLGEEIFKKEVSFISLISYLSDTSTNFNIFSLDGILTSMLSFSSCALLISFALRYILIKLLILATPFALLCLINKSTEGFFKSWYRSFLSLLLIQIIISALLIIPFALIKEDSTSIFNKLLIVGAISALLKSDQLVKEFLSGIGISTNFQAGISSIKSMISR